VSVVGDIHQPRLNVGKKEDQCQQYTSAIKGSEGRR
jgi:hypothetical protein